MTPHTVFLSTPTPRTTVTHGMTPAAPLHRHPERARGGKAGARRLRRLGSESKDPVAPRSIYLMDTPCRDVGSRRHGILRLRLAGFAAKPPLRMTENRISPNCREPPCLSPCPCPNGRRVPPALRHGDRRGGNAWKDITFTHAVNPSEGFPAQPERRSRGIWVGGENPTSSGISRARPPRSLHSSPFRLLGLGMTNRKPVWLRE
jgi:hypothetical protein